MDLVREYLSRRPKKQTYSSSVSAVLNDIMRELREYEERITAEYLGRAMDEELAEEIEENATQSFRSLVDSGKLRSVNVNAISMGDTVTLSIDCRPP